MRVVILRSARALLAPVAVLAVLLGTAPVAAATPGDGAGDGGIVVADQRIEVRDGPARDQVQSLDARFYAPAGAGAGSRAPAMLLAHGFGGNKDSLDAQARELAGRGYAVLAYTARGFGKSTGTIAMNNPDYEIADAQGLLDWLAARPEVRLDGPGDPRVGVMGESYGGALSLLLAGIDRRVDATVPIITWNDLGQALFPNSATADPAIGPFTPATAATGAGSPDGVFKKAWGGVFFGSGASGPAGSDASSTLACGRLSPEVCAGYQQAAATGRMPAGFAAYLARSSPASVAGRITAPTLLVQGERDTLFGLDQADATARQIAGGGGRVAVAWFTGGHDDGTEPDDDTRARMQAWLDHHVAGGAPDPGTAFTYTVASGVQARRAPTQRTVTAPSYPGLTGSPAPRLPMPLTGPAQDVLAPAGGSPAALSSLPGLAALAGGAGGGSGDSEDSGDSGGSGGSGGGGSGGGGGGGGGASALLGRLARDVPGQNAVFRTPAFTERTTISGAPTTRLAYAAAPGQPAPGEVVLFGKLYDAGAGDGAEAQRTLLGQAVAPIRLPAPPADGTPREVTVNLPAVASTVPAGHHLEVVFSTTDQAFALPAASTTVRLGPAGGAPLAVPAVPGEVRGGTTVPLGPLVAAAILLAGVAAAVITGRVVAARRRRRDREPGGDLAVDPALAEVPLVVRGLGKAWPGGLRAVDDVSFRVERGQVLGLLGPNGAGKTTTLRMLLGLIRPSEGELRVFGVRVVPGAPVLARVGAFVEGAGFLPHLSGRDNLASFWAATGRPTDESHLSDVLAIAGLGSAVDRAVRTYSQGMRQRLAIAQAMLGLPDLLVLDEPTNGLDPPQIHAMREVLRDYARSGPHGRTVLVSSHLLAEVEQTCSHVVVMHQGRVAATGEVADLVAGGHVELTVSDAARRDEAVRHAGAVDGVASATADERADDGVVVELSRQGPRSGNGHAPAGDVPAAIVRALVEAGVGVRAVTPRRRLEDAFLAIVEEPGGDPPTATPVGAGNAPGGHA